MYTNSLKRMLLVYFLIYKLKFLQTLTTTENELGVIVALKPYITLHKRVTTHSVGGSVKHTITLVNKMAIILKLKMHKFYNPVFSLLSACI